MVSDAEITRAAAHLRSGGVVIYPTGSYLAAGVLATLPEAVARLGALKGRPKDRPFGLIVATSDALPALGITMSSVERDLAARFWPGPLNLVLALTPVTPLSTLCPSGTVAVRVPGHRIARALAAACGGPITATSANRSGEPPVTAARDLGPEWQSPDLWILGDEPAGGELPSTIVEVRDGVVRVLRSGRIPSAELGIAP
jgi:L-threonylcarbamoyladenylate synthase